MKNIPSFKEFSIYGDLMETASQKQILDSNNLEDSNSGRNINEGQVTDYIKNSLSKFFLGKFSSIGVIDKARSVLVDLEVDLIEKKNELDDFIDNIESQIDSAGDKQTVESLKKQRENKLKEFQTYEEATRLKIKKAQQVVKEAIEGNPRKRKYYELGRSEDEVTIAELKYNLAKNKVDREELKKYKEKLEKAKMESSEKAEAMKSELKSDEEKTKKTQLKGKVELIDLDPENEAKKISSKKAKDIIERKRQLETSIANHRANLERKLIYLEKKISGGKKISPSYVHNKKIELLSIAATIEAQKNLLTSLRTLGKTEMDISKKLSDPEKIGKLTKVINKSITDGKESNTGLNKIISDIFVGPEGSIDIGKIKSAKEKLNK